MASSCIRNVRAAKVMKGLDLTVNVTGMKMAKLRLRLGLQLIRLAAWVSGTGFVLMNDNE